VVAVFDFFVDVLGYGLTGALLVGMTYGKVLALALGKPLIAVNHLEGHVHAVILEAHLFERHPEMPAVCLIVSGGHTVLYHVKSDSSNGDAAAKFSYVRIGGTRDDAAGEAYDKVARMLALGYPGGPVLDQLAAHGDPKAVRFGEPKMKSNPHDFSFSGIKTAMLYHLRRHPELQPEIDARQQALARGERTADALRQLSSAATLDLVANLAVNGYTSADLIRAELPAVAGLDPEFATVLIGVNDVGGAVTVGLAAIFLKEHVSRWQWLGIATVFLGIFLISR